MSPLRTFLPVSVRATMHQASGPLVVLLAAYGVANDSQAAAIVAAAVAVVDLIVALVHSESTARSLIYPVLATGAAVAINFGVASEDQLYAILGVAAAVLGHNLASRFTPPALAARHEPAPPVGS